MTKGRHHQKMRRQNSEDVNQFQYISGDQISSQQQSSSQTNSQHLGSSFSQQRAQMLEDRHFRRAGSQPATSSSHRQQKNDLFTPPMFSDRLLQASSGQQSQLQQQQHHQQQQFSAMSSGTNSTSSGVSSTTSSNLTPTVAIQHSTPVSSSVRRHLSAYSLLKSTPEIPTPSTASSGETIQPKLLTTSKPQTTSWTTKIKRSATTVNQTDFSSYVSKYRPSRRSGCSSVVKAQKHVVSAPPVSLAKATPTTNHGFFRRKLHNYNNNSGFFATNKHNMINNTNDSSSFSNHAEEYGGEDEEEAYEDDEDAEEREGEEEEEDDSNDIYSTPNDSIQSVPSTAPVICNNDKFTNNFAVHQVSSQAYPITKSFSTNNFGQQQQQQFKSFSQDTSNIKSNRFEPIEEFRVIDNNSTSKDNNNFQRQDSSQSNGKRLNGSRFFISSSSSEDSNSPPNQQRSTSRNQNQELDRQQLRKNYHNNNNHHSNSIKIDNNNNSGSINNESDDNGRQDSLLQQQASFQLEQQQNKLAIQHGVHYHNPTSSSPTHQAAIIRPDSLILTATTQASNGGGNALFLPVSLQTFTPTSTGIMVPSGGATTAALAAMSPIDTRLHPSSAFSHRTRLNLIEQTTASSNSNSNCNLRLSVSSILNQVNYKKSPSLFEISNGPTRLLNSSKYSSRYPSSAAFNPAAQKKSSLVNGQLFSGLKPIAAPRLPSNELMRLNNFSSVQQKSHTQQNGRFSQSSIPNSISLYDYKSISQDKDNIADHLVGLNSHRMSTSTTVNGRNEELLPYDSEVTSSEYKFAQILLESGSNLNAKDSNGYTALMHAVLSDNIPAIKCLIEHQVSLNEVNNDGLNVLDLICSKCPTETRVEVVSI